MSDLGKKAVSFATKQCVSLLVGATAGPLGLAILGVAESLFCELGLDLPEIPEKLKEKLDKELKPHLEKLIGNKAIEKLYGPDDQSLAAIFPKALKKALLKVTNREVENAWFDKVDKAIDAGAQFGLSPAFNQPVCNEAKLIGFPFVPGVMTPTEIELANEQGFKIQKLFPAEQLGGVSFLKAILAPYEQLKINFIPMGGVNMQNISSYIKLKNVIAVGGSWLATKELMADKNYKAIKNNVEAALAAVK